MPSISYRSAVKETEESFNVVLKARHSLVYGSSSDPVQAVGRFPAIDILLDADLVLSVSGVHGKRLICADEMEKSYPVQHLHSFLNMVRRPCGRASLSYIHHSTRRSWA